ncbi:MAG: penicillin-binding protein activator [Gammaproteobacteria bacterium]|nr:penicillin-binding protein activator [Gammaproteobacteria bacterium]
MSIARREGAELAIGPLARERVTEITNLRSLPFPVLALNRSLGGSVNADVYQFGLSPEDEVVQVARQVHSEGKRNALALYADSVLAGRCSFDTFRQTLERSGWATSSTQPLSTTNEARLLRTPIKTPLDGR